MIEISPATDSAFKIFLRDRVVCTLVLPVNGQDPPAFAVIKKLKTVDAAREGLSVRSASGIVGAERVQHGSECFAGAMQLALEKALTRVVFGVAALAVGGGGIIVLGRTPGTAAVGGGKGGRVGNGGLPPEITEELSGPQDEVPAEAFDDIGAARRRCRAAGGARRRSTPRARPGFARTRACGR